MRARAARPALDADDEWRFPRRLDGLTVESGAVPPGTRFRGHEHEGIHLCCVTRGGFVETMPGGPTDVGPGTVRVSPSARHDITFAPAGASCVLLHLDGDAAGILGRSPGRSPARSVFLSDDRLQLLAARLAAAVRRRGHAADLELDGVVTELLAQVARRRTGRRAGPPPPWLELAREMVHDCGAAPVSLAAVAATVGVHRVHLARAFRDHYGEPIGRRVRRLRLQRALLLLEDDLPLAQVAARAGYADQSHLTREVTARLGAPPARLRRRLATPVQDPAPAAADIRSQPLPEALR
jgi:AraC family transcriptional regulator